jgi:hypothetical protein
MRRTPGRAAFLVVLGEAGIGKSRLLSGMMRIAAAQGAAVLSGRAFPGGGRSGGERISLLDLFDGRLTLLTGEPDSAFRAATTELADEGLPITAVSIGGELLDPDGAFELARGLGVFVERQLADKAAGDGAGKEIWRQRRLSLTTWVVAWQGL